MSTGFFAAGGPAKDDDGMLDLFVDKANDLLRNTPKIRDSTFL
jgi:hypothetical protein